MGQLPEQGRISTRQSNVSVDLLPGNESVVATVYVIGNSLCEISPACKPAGTSLSRSLSNGSEASAVPVLRFHDLYL